MNVRKICTRVGNLFIDFSSKSLVFVIKWAKVQFAIFFLVNQTFALFQRATWTNRSRSLFYRQVRDRIRSSGSLQKSIWVKSDVNDLLLGIKIGKKTYEKYEFLSESLFLASNSLELQVNHSHRSFLKSNESSPICSFVRAKWANRSCSLFT